MKAMKDELEIFNNFFYKVLILSLVFYLFDYIIMAMHDCEWVPEWNNFFKNRLYLFGIGFAILIFIVIALILNIKYYYQVSLFHTLYQEHTICKVRDEKDIYLSKINSGSSFLRYKTSVFRVYKDEFPFVKILRDIPADTVNIITSTKVDLELLSLNGSKKDTISISLK